MTTRVVTGVMTTEELHGESTEPDDERREEHGHHV
jgi:hypothetical protein